jgi:acetylornithine/succinyldiaminopimelate/putrescine aminotransferase
MHPGPLAAKTPSAVAPIGVMVSANGVSAIEMAPPLIVTRADLDNAVEVCAKAVHEVAAKRNLA